MEDNKYLFELVIFIFGLIGNTVGLITFLIDKKLNNIGTRNIYIYLFIVDSMFLFVMCLNSLTVSFDLEFANKSNLFCKSYHYLTHALATISPMLLCYISAERYLSLESPTRRFILRKNSYQFMYFKIVLLLNMIYYSPCFILFELEQIESNNVLSLKCDYIDSKSETLLSIMDLINRALIPCSLMLAASILLINSISKSRSRIVRDSSRINKFLIKDIRLGITSICLNLVYMLFSLPYHFVVVFINYSNDIILYMAFVFFCFSYGFNFYVLYLSNKLFRNEFKLLFKLKTSSSTARRNAVTETNFL